MGDDDDDWPKLMRVLEGGAHFGMGVAAPFKQQLRKKKKKKRVGGTQPRHYFSLTLHGQMQNQVHF